MRMGDARDVDDHNNGDDCDADADDHDYGDSVDDMMIISHLELQLVWRHGSHGCLRLRGTLLLVHRVASISCACVHKLLHQESLYSHLAPSSAHIFTPVSIKCAHVHTSLHQVCIFHASLHQERTFSQHTPSSEHIYTPLSIKCTHYRISLHQMHIYYTECE